MLVLRGWGAEFDLWVYRDFPAERIRRGPSRLILLPTANFSRATAKVLMAILSMSTDWGDSHTPRPIGEVMRRADF
ncbi:hypothetical protein PAPYR_13276 [Paratrimastix pyriformis]|uniref:Type II toxin-antitoxin system PemK/MazF family toxin n=1 Tax=Paratrimastix pyriformis TaxID=342808 RepID=A0ABQ8U1Z5_9EUKA|nr:hypothetical protein PAPYR_13276 [Paratrimastix pyriformis]